MTVALLRPRNRAGHVESPKQNIHDKSQWPAKVLDLFSWWACSRHKACGNATPTIEQMTQMPPTDLVRTCARSLVDILVRLAETDETVRQPDRKAQI
ncbi:TPA: hypothetical protein ACH3X1_013026 [Trebouxia sp. C0004]